MSFWKVPAVVEEPVVTLSRWRVVSISRPGTEEREHHFNGYHADSMEGRVSTAVLEFDRKTKTGTTRSGRKYKLRGRAALDFDALYVWEAWARLNKVDLNDVVDVSDEYGEEE